MLARRAWFTSAPARPLFRLECKFNWKRWIFRSYLYCPDLFNIKPALVRFSLRLVMARCRYPLAHTSIFAAVDSARHSPDNRSPHPQMRAASGYRIMVS